MASPKSIQNRMPSLIDVPVKFRHFSHVLSEFVPVCGEQFSGKVEPELFRQQMNHFFFRFESVSEKDEHRRMSPCES